MILTINGETRKVPPESTVGTLLISLGLDQRLVVVERNREILRDRASLGSVLLEDGDVVEIVHFVGGG